MIIIVIRQWKLKQDVLLCSLLFLAQQSFLEEKKKRRRKRTKIDALPCALYVSLQITLASWFYHNCEGGYIRHYQYWSQLTLSTLTLYSLQKVNTKLDHCPNQSVVQAWWLNISTGPTDRLEAYFLWPPTLHGPTASISENQVGSACLLAGRSTCWMCSTPAWTLITLVSFHKDNSPSSISFAELD